MPDRDRALRAWLELASILTDSLPPHVEVCVPQDLAPHPARAGLKRTLGLGRGHHYALPLPSGGRLHVRVLRGEHCYRAHWDLRDPSSDPLGHLLLDAPSLAAVAAGALNSLLELARAPAVAPLLGGLLTGAAAALIASGLARLLWPAP